MLQDTQVLKERYKDTQVELVLKVLQDKEVLRVNSGVRKVLKVLWVRKGHKVHKMVYRATQVLKVRLVNKEL